MKQRLSPFFYLGLALSLLILCAACSQEPKDPDFRNIRWGMSVQEVKAAEGLPVAAEGIPVAIEGPIPPPEQYFLEYKNIEYLGKNFTLRYFFYKNECYLAALLYYNADKETYDQILAEYVKINGPGKRLYESDKIISDSWDKKDISNFLTYLYNRENNIVMIRFLSDVYFPPEVLLPTGAKIY